MARKHKVSGKSIDNIVTNYTTVFKRSGYNYSKRLLSLAVKNNAVRLKALNAAEGATSAKNQASTTFNLTKQDVSGDEHVFLTDAARTTKKNYESQQLAKQQEMCLVNRMIQHKPSESMQCMRTIGRILHPQIPERYLSLKHALASTPNKSKELGQELEEEFTKSKVTFAPFSRYKEYEAMPQKNFDIVSHRITRSHAYELLDYTKQQIKENIRRGWRARDTGCQRRILTRCIIPRLQQSTSRTTWQGILLTRPCFTNSEQGTRRSGSLVSSLSNV
eukprot:TRINITY_DN9903_c0_g1_i4.p1 TRINITY_DN9903_c0_g1~~TRINITY_DN9903_c0_g1_i4.p1  ORF type:complete len:276 (-),score=34.75 TRINITY_DN9903_c0_g1_i4:90-917(-)